MKIYVIVAESSVNSGHGMSDYIRNLNSNNVAFITKEDAECWRKENGFTLSIVVELEVLVRG